MAMLGGKGLGWINAGFTLGMTTLLAACSTASTSGSGGDGGDSNNGGGAVASGGNDTNAGGSGTGNGGSPSAGGAESGGANSGGADGSGNGGNGASAGGDGSSGNGGSGTSNGGSGGEDTGGANTGGNGGSSTSGAGGGEPVGSASCNTIATFDVGIEPSREVFVDAAAAGPGDGSEADPYPDLDSALGDVSPGTAVRLLPGTYAGGAFGSDFGGTAEAPIWIGGVPGEARPVISGGDTAFQFSGISYVVIHDLEVTGQAANGVNVDDGSDTANEVTHHVVFRNLSIHDVGAGGNQDCLKLSGVNDYYVLDSDFEACSGSAVDHVGCHRGLIARNTFQSLNGNGVQSKGGSDDIEIRQNRFIDAGERAVNMGGSTGFEFFRPPLSLTEPNFEARNIRVVANLFQRGTSPIAFVGCVDCLAANNTVVDPIQWVFRILQETTSTEEYEFLPAQNGRFSNNLIRFSRGDLSTYVNVGADTSPESFELSNNLWYAADSVGESEPNPLPAPETDGIYGEDPGFTGTDDFSLVEGSPALGAGVSLDDIAGDLNGTCYADPPSIGAYERE